MQWFERILRPVSLNRFDQQLTTKPHRDGGPQESVLILGYEPTSVASTLSLVDDVRYAMERGEQPLAFQARFNPLANNGLHGHTTRLSEFRPEHYQILLINRSMQQHVGGRPHLGQSNS